jgi:hypothetical protein
MGETPFEIVSGRISPKWGKHSQIEHACGIFSNILYSYPFLNMFNPYLFSSPSPKRARRHNVALVEFIYIPDFLIIIIIIDVIYNHI